MIKQAERPKATFAFKEILLLSLFFAVNTRD